MVVKPLIMSLKIREKQVCTVPIAYKVLYNRKQYDSAMLHDYKTFHCANIRVRILSQIVHGFNLTYQTQGLPHLDWNSLDALYS